MKKQYLPLALALALFQGVSAQSRFDASSQIYADHYLDFVREPGAELVEIPGLPFTINPASRSEITADVMLILNEGTTAEDIESFGLTVKGIIGNVAVCSGSMDDIISLADTDLTIQVSFPREITPMLDKARADKASGVDKVHEGTGLDMPYKGKGVITGIFDVGMDPNHVNFLNSDLTENRIKNLWLYDSYGRVSEYRTPEAVASFTTDNRAMTHGTHTMGCMAGSYNGKGDFYTSYGLSGSTLNKNKPVPFYGMAPEAEIAAACGDNTTANIVLACQQLASYIKSTGKPGLISLSFGSYLGPHDNSDPATTALNTIAKDIPFYIAAGNDGGETFSLVGTFGNGNNSAKTFIRPEGSSAQGEVAIWSGDNRPLTVRMIIFDRTTEQELYSYTIPTGESKVLATGNYSTPSYIRDEAIDLAFTRSTIQVSQKLSNANNRYQTSIIYNLSLAATNSSQRYALGIAVEGANGQHYDLVQKTGSPSNSSINRADLSGWGIKGWLDGTDEMSISDLSCGTNMLCIGSWNTRVSWTNLGNNSYTYGGDYRINQVSPFTSYGTLADGRTLPLVCAPGAGIISSISSHYYSAMGLTQRDVAATAVYNGKTNYYELQQGTSMATPVAAGIGALWLQANPDLTPADIKYIITHTSDAQTDANRQIAWGHGRINALEGIKMAVKIGAGVSDVTVNPADIIIAADGNNWQVVAPGAASVNTVVYDLNGRPVISSNVKGDTAEISGESLQPGIYVINVNNVLSRRIAVK